MKIDVIEIELSSLCNARCSDCMRTKLDNKKISYFKGNLSLKQIKQNFYNLDMKDTKIKLCGVLGDPMLNPELELIIEYFIFNKNVKNIEMSTNGGAKTKDFWKNSVFGKLVLYKISCPAIEVILENNMVSRF